MRRNIDPVSEVTIVERQASVSLSSMWSGSLRQTTLLKELYWARPAYEKPSVPMRQPSTRPISSGRIPQQASRNASRPISPRTDAT